MGRLKRLKGDLYLGYRAAIAHPLRELFRSDERSGKQRFLDNYAPEGLVPLTLDDRDVLKGASRCIHCGLCEMDGPKGSIAGSFDQWPSALPLVYSRATPSLRHAARALGQFRDHELRRAEAVCPTQVPLRAIAAYLRRKLEELH